MAYREKEIERVYWDICDVAAELLVETSCIRFWLQEFDIDYRIKRTERGNRKFTSKDVDLLREIHRLRKVEEYTFKGARKKLLAAGLITVKPHRGRPVSLNEEMENIMRVI